ncbi:hypothetical protein ACHAXA_004567 [Cyclostephanos tholiformis]|uniref:Uncharacterized protein n=1 Tax=Cyclostephanos tholiformis TaxID=382380 RepID=A0ABD3RHC7_9STRA
MVLGKAGMRLEAQKFVVYLLIPITASVAFNEPTVQKWAADYFQFMKYPSNPRTNLREEYEALKKQRDEEVEWERHMAERREAGREEYRKQLKLIQLGATTRGGGGGESDDSTESSRTMGWFDWLRGRTRGGSI